MEPRAQQRDMTNATGAEGTRTRRAEARLSHTRAGAAQGGVQHQSQLRALQHSGEPACSLHTRTSILH